MYKLEDFDINDIYGDDSNNYVDEFVKIKGQLSYFRLIVTDRYCYMLNTFIEQEPVSTESFIFVKIPFKELVKAKVSNEVLSITLNSTIIDVIFENDELPMEFVLAAML